VSLTACKDLKYARKEEKGMNGEMVEPDRTIMIISIIGLVVIWGSFFYHKFVQGGEASTGDSGVSESGGQASDAGSGAKKAKNKKSKC
tara:strand:+ start:116 stop:379 length:264 start_codon:yes stop_codon:yes gene_type:complete